MPTDEHHATLDELLRCQRAKTRLKREQSQHYLERPRRRRDGRRTYLERIAGTRFPLAGRFSRGSLAVRLGRLFLKTTFEENFG